MSDNSPVIYGIPQTVSLPVGDIGIGSYIVNDYLITVADSEDDNGYLLTIRKGSQIQEIHLTELKQEAVDAAIEQALREAKESGEFDGNGIERAVLNSDYTLTLYFTDGTSVTTTSIRGETGNGIQSVTMNPDYTLTITFTDGDIYTTGSIRGLTGNGISEVVLNSDYTLTIRYTDGNSYTTTSIRGAKGDTGVSISGIIFNSDYTLTIECTDGTSYTTDSIRGDKGETGTGISSARLNDDFTLTLNFDDGNSYTTRSIRGEKGAKGDKGDPGESFEIHACTSTEYDYDTRIPTIENPKANCLYLVPSSDAITTDLFVEWVYIYGRWEKFGSAEINLDAYAKKTEVAAKLDKPLRDGLSGQILVSNGSGGQTWNDLAVPDWNASNGSTGFIRNKPDLKAGTGTDSVVNRHSLVSGSHSMAVGTNNAASGDDNFVTGNGNSAKGSGSILSGNHNTAELRGSNSVVSGTNNLVSSSNNLVSGTINSVGGNNSVVGGSNNVVSGSCSLAVGDNNTASGTYSTVEGSHTTATMNAAHAEGTGTTASGDSSHAEGNGTIASGITSHSEGSATTASGVSSHAEGWQSVASKQSAHAEGGSTIASGNYSHAEGTGSEASGSRSHAEGYSTVASGHNAHAEGNCTIANHKSQHTFGEYNTEDPSSAASTARGNYVEIVGKGTSANARSNARTLDWNGNEWIAGNFKMGGNSYDDPNAKTVGPIDDSAGSGDTDKTWSADKIASELANAGSVQDVTVNGTSVVGQGGVAEIPVASANTLGVVRTRVGDNGLQTLSDGYLATYPASSADIKGGIQLTRPITSNRLNEATFYGLAKAAGDTTQSASANAVGTYTDAAKASIKAMLGVGGETQKVTVSGTAPVIVANQNTRYVCGEVVSLDFTPSAEGICDVIFTSGSTVTVLTIPNTVIFPEWFDPTTLETNKTYEISISDGVYGAVMVW